MHSDIGRQQCFTIRPKIHTASDFLGPKELRNTEICMNIERSIFEPTSDESTVKVAEKPEDVKDLLEVGVEYVRQKSGLIFLGKRK
jgi:hypothetical protein